LIICGLKLTHDGTVALLDNEKLIFSVEMEKINNNRRYSNIINLDIIVSILKDFGYKLTDIDRWVIDGWGADFKSGQSEVKLLNFKDKVTIRLGSYHEGDGSSDDVFAGLYEDSFFIGKQQFKYKSYSHVLGHISSTYCTSPFSTKLEPAMVMVWDGGMFPRLYYVDPKYRKIEVYGYFIPISGHIYTIAACHFGPYKLKKQSNYEDNISVAGKLMAYIALGTSKKAIKKIIQEKYDYYFTQEGTKGQEYLNDINNWGTSVQPAIKYMHSYFEDIKASLNKKYSEEDILATIHDFLEHLIVNNLVDNIKKWKGTGAWNLCLAGGCALNIKWNSAFRAHPNFKDVWVPPFPNDSGSAIGAAATCLFEEKNIVSLKWNVYLGPKIRKATKMLKGWVSESCNIEKLAKILHHTGNPIVFLNERSELGPRALGNRSIIAPAVTSQMKDLLNNIKYREYFRPVAPLCLTNFATKIFDPGTPDPYMLFQHYVRKEWIKRIPAIVHLDNTARLQTVDDSNNSIIATLLKEYYKLSGIPVLCNTSANYNGCGFFPDVVSAMEWGRINMIWSDGTLYINNDIKVDYPK